MYLASIATEFEAAISVLKRGLYGQTYGSLKKK